jgi:hypothetical protein
VAVSPRTVTSATDRSVRIAAVALGVALVASVFPAFAWRAAAATSGLDESVHLDTGRWQPLGDSGARVTLDVQPENVDKWVYLAGVVVARFADSDYQRNILQGAAIDCYTDTPPQSPRTKSTRNHEKGGRSTDWLRVPVRTLFKPTTAATYSCDLYGLGGVGPGLTAKPYGDGSGSYLFLDRAWHPGWQWGIDDDPKDCDYTDQGDVDGWPCDPDYTHVGINYFGHVLPAGTAEYVVQSPHPPHDDLLDLTGLIRLRVRGDPELTACYGTTPAECSAPYAHGQPYSAHTVTVVDSRLEAYQYDADGSICRRAFAPASGLLRTRITTDAHHQKITHNLDWTLASPPTCTSKRVRIRVYIKVVSGNPVAIVDRGWSVGMVFGR